MPSKRDGAELSKHEKRIWDALTAEAARHAIAFDGNMRREAIALELPLPDRRLHPNARAHYAVKMQAKKQHKAEVETFVWADCREWFGSQPKWPRAIATVTLFNETARRHDADNLLAWLKATFDGIVSGGLLEDDKQLQVMQPAQEKDKTRPRLVVTLYRAKLESVKLARVE